MYPVSAELTDIPDSLPAYRTRSNQLLCAALEQIQDTVNTAIDTFGAKRIAVITGTSTSGIAEGENAVNHYQQHQTLPEHFVYKQQEIAATSEVIARLTGASGPTYSVSTSCSSSSGAICSAQRLLDHDLCDAVIVGGSDALCQTTMQGFNALGAISQSVCNPFSRNRDGIVIGEGAALFVVCRDPDIISNHAPIRLYGSGMSADAYHISAPDPSGDGAKSAMQRALKSAGLDAEAIDYINLHGTATPQNDAMESKAVYDVFGTRTLCSSTKPLTGHCLGASGIIELALCWLALSHQHAGYHLLEHRWDGQRDNSLPQLNLLETDNLPDHQPSIMMSNTYSFGGNNVSLIIGVER